MDKPYLPPVVNTTGVERLDVRDPITTLEEALAALKAAGFIGEVFRTEGITGGRSITVTDDGIKVYRDAFAIAVDCEGGSCYAAIPRGNVGHRSGPVTLEGAVEFVKQAYAKKGGPT